MSEPNSKNARLLDGKARRALRARAHALRPVVWIADAGATPSVLREINRTLEAHELIKIHAAVDGRVARESLMTRICIEAGAEPVQIIGKMLVVYRKRTEDEEGEKPRRPATVRARQGRAAKPRAKSR